MVVVRRLEYAKENGENEPTCFLSIFGAFVIPVCLTAAFSASSGRPEGVWIGLAVYSSKFTFFSRVFQPSSLMGSVFRVTCAFRFTRQ